MKAYMDYMNSVTVSDALHRKIMDGVIEGPKRRTVARRRYVTAFACAAIVVAGLIAVPRLLARRLIADPGGTVYTPGPVLLTFNKVAGFTDIGTSNPYQFTQELTEAEIAALLPSLSDTHEIAAAANFSGDGTLFTVDATAVDKETGTAVSLTLANGPVKVDYIMPGEPTVSEVNGIPVIAAYFENKDDTTWCASFEIDGVGYYLEVRGGEGTGDKLPTIITAISQTSPGTLNVIIPAIPRLREVSTIDEALADPDFGAYVPDTIPSGFRFESARRVQDKTRNYLWIMWYSDTGRLDYAEWRISFISSEDESRLVDVGKTETYDLSLYPIPRAESVPDELREIVDNPIFRIEDLTLDVVNARSYQVDDAGDTPGNRASFSVLYGKVLVEIRIKGMEAEAIFDILKAL